MNKERDTTTLGINMETNTIDVVLLDDDGNVTSSMAICPIHPNAVDAVISILLEMKSHMIEVVGEPTVMAEPETATRH